MRALHYPLRSGHPGRVAIPALLSDAGNSYPVIAPILDPFYYAPLQLASVGLKDKTGVLQKYHVFYRSLPSAPPNLSLFNSHGLRRRGDIVVLKVGRRQDYVGIYTTDHYRLAARAARWYVQRRFVFYGVNIFIIRAAKKYLGTGGEERPLLRVSRTSLPQTLKFFVSAFIALALLLIVADWMRVCLLTRLSVTRSL